MLRSAEWYFSTDFLEKPIGPIFLDYLTLEVGTDRLSRNVGTELQTNTE
jgi:hypothetical protein